MIQIVPDFSDNVSDSSRDEGQILNVTEDDLLEAKALASTFSLEDTRRVSH